MSLRKGRCVLTGLALAAGLILAMPRPSEASGALSALVCQEDKGSCIDPNGWSQVVGCQKDQGSCIDPNGWWQQVVYWLADLWHAAWEEESLSPPRNPTSQEGSGTSLIPICRADEGSCIDPNG